MSKKYPEGFTFYDYQMRVCTVHSFSEQFNCYMIIEEDNPRALYHWSESNIDDVMSKQERIINFDKQQKEIRLKQDKEEREREEQYNNVYGFCDNMTALQKGKVLKCLNVINRYDNYGNLPRKEFIFKALQDGLKPGIQYNVTYYSRKGYTTKPVVYIMDAQEYSIDITKTEYNYAIYLIENVL